MEIQEVKMAIGTYLSNMQTEVESIITVVQEALFEDPGDPRSLKSGALCVALKRLNELQEEYLEPIVKS